MSRGKELDRVAADISSRMVFGGSRSKVNDPDLLLRLNEMQRRIEVLERYVELLTGFTVPRENNEPRLDRTMVLAKEVMLEMDRDEMDEK